MTFDTPSRLRRLKVHEISVVGAPAVLGAQIALAKAADPLDAMVQKAMSAVSTGATAAAVALAKAGTPAPASFWRGALAGLTRSLTEPGIPPAEANHLALLHPDGKLLLAALHRAPG